MKDIIIIDFDGTLCNDKHRDHLAKVGEWEEFHKLHMDDTPWEDVVELLKMCSDEVVIAVTGRNEKWRTSTTAWLNKHHLAPYIDAILMRADDDFRPISEVKLSLLEEWFAEYAKIMGDNPTGEESGWCTAGRGTLKDRLISKVKFVLDDRDKMVEAYREYGLPCWQVRPGGY